MNEELAHSVKLHRVHPDILTLIPHTISVMCERYNTAQSLHQSGCSMPYHWPCSKGRCQNESDLLEDNKGVPEHG